MIKVYYTISHASTAYQSDIYNNNSYITYQISIGSDGTYIYKFDKTAPQMGRITAAYYPSKRIVKIEQEV